MRRKDQSYDDLLLVRTGLTELSSDSRDTFPSKPSELAGSDEDENDYHATQVKYFNRTGEAQHFMVDNVPGDLLLTEREERISLLEVNRSSDGSTVKLHFDNKTVCYIPAAALSGTISSLLSVCLNDLNRATASFDTNTLVTVTSGQRMKKLHDIFDGNVYGVVKPTQGCLPTPGLPSTNTELASNIINAFLLFHTFDVEWYFPNCPKLRYQARISSAFFEGKTMRFIAYVSSGKYGLGVKDRPILLHEAYQQTAKLNGYDLKEKRQNTTSTHAAIHPSQFQSKPIMFIKAIFVVTGPRPPPGFSADPLHEREKPLSLYELVKNAHRLDFRMSDVQRRTKEICSTLKFFERMSTGDLSVLLQRTRRGRPSRLFLAERSNLVDGLSKQPNKVKATSCESASRSSVDVSSRSKVIDLTKPLALSCYQSNSSSTSHTSRRLLSHLHGEAELHLLKCTSRFDGIMELLSSEQHQEIQQVNRAMAKYPHVQFPLMGLPVLPVSVSGSCPFQLLECNEVSFINHLEGTGEVHDLTNLMEVKPETEQEHANLRALMKRATATQGKLKGIATKQKKAAMKRNHNQMRNMRYPPYEATVETPEIDFDVPMWNASAFRVNMNMSPSYQWSSPGPQDTNQDPSPFFSSEQEDLGFFDESYF